MLGTYDLVEHQISQNLDKSVVLLFIKTRHHVPGERRIFALFISIIMRVFSVIIMRVFSVCASSFLRRLVVGAINPAVAWNTSSALASMC